MCPRRHWFDLPELSPAGRVPPAALARPAGAVPGGGVCPSAALARPAEAVPGGGRAPGGTCYPCPGGEDHLKRRSSSPPVPPLLGWRHCSPVPRPNRQGFESPCTAVITKGTCFPQEKPMPLPTQPRGCKGRSPLHMKSKNLPLPRRGRGAGGWGQKSKQTAG